MVGRHSSMAWARWGRLGVNKALQIRVNRLSVILGFCGRADILLPGIYPT
jgi:hypothetical protein